LRVEGGGIAGEQHQRLRLGFCALADGFFDDAGGRLQADVLPHLLAAARGERAEPLLYVRLEAVDVHRADYNKREVSEIPKTLTIDLERPVVPSGLEHRGRQWLGARVVLLHGKQDGVLEHLLRILVAIGEERHVLRPERVERRFVMTRRSGLEVEQLQNCFDVARRTTGLDHFGEVAQVELHPGPLARELLA
jgi:hypothetical protein